MADQEFEVTALVEVDLPAQLQIEQQTECTDHVRATSAVEYVSQEDSELFIRTADLDSSFITFIEDHCTQQSVKSYHLSEEC